MPFTPFHFGPGLLVKSVASRHFSWSTFVGTQVVIDCETLYCLVQHTYPIHRTLHTFLGATAAGLATATALLGCRQLLGQAAPQVAKTMRESRPLLQSETSTVGILMGGIIGGASHPFLDGIMHRDVRPFAPWSDANPLLNSIGLGPLHILCLVSGLVGLAIIGILYFKERKAG